MAALAPWHSYFDLSTRELSVRTLRQGERLPPSLPHGLPFGFISCQPDWIWLAEHKGEPLALLIAAPAQNIAYLMRICAAGNDSATRVAALMLLLRTAFRDMRQRGYIGYMVNLGTSSLEKRLRSMIMRASKGKAIITEGLALVAASTDIGGL